MKPSETTAFSFRRELERIKRQEAQRAARELIVHPQDEMVAFHQSCLSCFCQACITAGYLTAQQMEHAAGRYRLGMARNGGVIFWQLNPLGKVCDGKVMYYRPDCHRDHSHNPTWVMSELKRFYRPPVDIPSVHCLFGLHLLKDDATIAVVEAEKTAVILSELYPQYVWMAAGGLNELSAIKLFPLRNNQVVLFPDTDPDCKAYSLWYHVAQEAKRCYGARVSVSSLLERRATADQKTRKIDLIDFIFEQRR
jgi:hypothetical protein